MSILPGQDVVDKLPAAEFEHSLREFCTPLHPLMPDKRLFEVLILIIRGIVAAQSPVITRIAATVSRLIATPRACSARIYRLLDNSRLSVSIFRSALDARARANVERENPDRLVVAIDPVNFEKPYTKKLPGVSVVHKASPPDLKDGARLARGYPAITATIVNTRVPTTTYANWFSYTLDFVSQNREISQAIDHTALLFSNKPVRFVCDAGFDDQKIFAHFAEAKTEFISRVCHHNRLVEVYNERTKKWEPEKLADLTACVLYKEKWSVSHNHARKIKEIEVQVGWFKLRLPAQPEQELWALVIEDIKQTIYARPLVLVTNVPITSGSIAAVVYEDFRLRPRIEDGYRFDQEQGLDVEDMRLQSLEGMRKLFILVLLAAQFVFYLLDTWPPKAIRWIRDLGGKQGVAADRDGPYIFLWGLVSLCKTFLTLSHLSVNPFPHEFFLGGQKCV